MGLAAGQARLLTITGRKSDCEFESMRISHQKIALARDLAALSNEYQNSLNQTKLIWDYYGTGDESTQLSYGLLMNPSVLNDYSPIILSDASGRAVLNEKYAKAAKAAGIPQEGLGTLASENVRNKFINALASSECGLITQAMADKITSLPYSQGAGFGDTTTVSYTYQSGNVDDLIEYIDAQGAAYTNKFGGTIKEVSKVEKINAKEEKQTVFLNILQGNNYDVNAYLDNACCDNIKLSDLLSSEQYNLVYWGLEGEQSPVLGMSLMRNFLKGTSDQYGFLDFLKDEFSAILDIGDGTTGAALTYAYNETEKILGSTTSNKSYDLFSDGYIGGYRFNDFFLVTCLVS